MGPTLYTKERGSKMKLMIALFLAAMFVVMSGPALAGDLKNEDSQSYRIEIIENSFTRQSSISSGTTMMSVCSDCVIRLVDTGTEVQMGENDTIIIKNGGMRKQRY